MEFFIDSNIIIEYLKENGLKESKEILNYLLNKKIIPYISFTVINEVLFVIYFKKKLLSFNELLNFLDSFYTLYCNKMEEILALHYMKKHNLKPNDALILATCKHYNIKHLISLDEDFKEPCEKEGIILINSVEKLKEVLNT